MIIILQLPTHGYCFAERRVLKFKQSHFLSGFLHSYSQFTSRVTSISDNEMNMFKIPFKCRALQRAIGMFISFSEILVTRVT